MNVGKAIELKLKRLIYVVYGCTSLFGLYGPLSLAYDPNASTVVGHELPTDLANVGITEKLGLKLSRQREFTNSKGEKVLFGDFFKKGKPVFFSIVYYNCPSLCNYHLNGVVDALKKVNLKPGKDFELVALSMDHRESVEIAETKRLAYVESYGDVSTDTGWHFLLGTEENIKAIADEVGFGFAWNEKQQQFAHAAAAYIVSPELVLTRYLYGIEFQPQTLRLALLEGGEGKIGNLVDQIILFCFQFNPAKNKYTLYAWNVMRAGAVLMLFAILALLVPAWLREKRKQRAIA